MAKSVSELASNATVQSITNALTGPATTKSYKVKSGSEVLAGPRPFTLQVFGDMGTGKSLIIKDLLLLGMRVLVVDTDFGQGGMNTVWSWLSDHPEHEHLRENVKSVQLDYDGVVQFNRDPTVIFPDIWTFDPDVLFWDGSTAFQESHLEGHITRYDPLREDVDWKDWKSTRNGTIFTLMKILALQKPDGRPLSKVVTALSETKGKSRPTGKPGERETIPGTERTGPKLHTEARIVSGAGFDIILQTTVKTFGVVTKFEYVNKGAELLTKDRFGLPASMEANFVTVFNNYIAPRIGWEPRNVTPTFNDVLHQPVGLGPESVEDVLKAK